jgi:hypothetical protein
LNKIISPIDFVLLIKMASGDKAELARAGTMEVTSKEGRAFLEKNLTEWKKPLLLDAAVDDSKSTSSTSSGKKGRGGKKTAAKDTEEIDEEDYEQPAAKKARMAKATTMEVTAKEGKELIGDKKLGDTRQVTKLKEKGSAKRISTINQAVAEAKAVYGSIDSGEGRSLRKRAAVVPSPAKKAKQPAKKSSMKKAGTMQKTAKEAAELLGDEELGDTRQVTQAKQQKKTAAAAKTSKQK